MVSPAKLLTIVGHIAPALWCEIVTEIACHTTHYQRPVTECRSVHGPSSCSPGPILMGESFSSITVSLITHAPLLRTRCRARAGENGGGHAITSLYCHTICTAGYIMAD